MLLSQRYEFLTSKVLFFESFITYRVRQNTWSVELQPWKLLQKFVHFATIVQGTIVTKGKARRGRGDFCSVTILFTLANFRTLLWYCFAMWIVFWSIEIWTKVTCSLHNLNKKTSLELDGPCDLTQAVFFYVFTPFEIHP